MRAWQVPTFLGLVAGVFLATATPASAREVRVAIVQTPDATGPDDSLRELRAAIAQTLGEQGIGVVPEADVAAASRSCLLFPECGYVLAKTGATHVLLVRPRYRDETFQLELSLWSTAGKAALFTETRDCAICDVKDFLQAGRTLAKTVGTRLLSLGDDAAGSATGVDAPERDATPTPTWVRVALVTVTVAALVVSGISFAQHGSCTDFEGGVCREKRQSLGTGIGFLAVGTVAAGVTIWKW